MQMEQRIIQESWTKPHQHGMDAKAAGRKVGYC
jgi:hypothetical protein